MVTRREVQHEDEVREEYQAPRGQTRPLPGTRPEQLPATLGPGGSHGWLRGCRSSFARRGASGGARRARRRHRPVPLPAGSEGVGGRPGAEGEPKGSV